VLDKIKICTNFPYLPVSTTTGSYYYITKTSNGNIYAFGLESNFKYNGEKWQEVSKLGTQVGFSPYRSFIETGLDAMIASNNNMCGTYKDSIFIFVPVSSSMNKNKIISYLLKFEDDSNDGRWTTISIQDSYFETLAVQYDGTDVNNIVTVIVGNKLYIFGGVYKDEQGNHKINKYVGIYDIISSDFSKRDLVPNNTYIIYNNLRFFNYSKALVSKDNEIYLIGVKNISGGDTQPFIYKYILSNDKIVDFKKVGGCPTVNEFTVIKPNNGGIICYLHEDSNKEYITIISRSDTKSEIIWRTELGDKKQGQYIQMYKPNNQSNIKKRDDLISNLFVLYTSNVPAVTYVSCYLEMNGLLFLVTGYGDIMRCNNYKQDIDDKFNIVPCYGVELYEKPLYNVKRCNNLDPGTAPDGWKWSDILCGYYKLPFTDVNSKDCTNYGSFCDGECKPDGECGTGWTTTTLGTCAKTSPSCRMLCRLDNVKKDFYYCDKNSKKWQKCASDKCDGGLWDSTSNDVLTGKYVSEKCYTLSKSELSSYCPSPVS
jgi:hypothetical protein